MLIIGGALSTGETAFQTILRQEKHYALSIRSTSRFTNRAAGSRRIAKRKQGDEHILINHNTLSSNL
ncbi:MAG: hypothetical protein ACM3PY_14895 [Omnitrophica WOR_2 bacterium]